VKCEGFSITHHNAPVDFLLILLLISCKRYCKNCFQAGSRIDLTAQTFITISIQRGSEMIMISCLFVQVCIHSPCYSRTVQGAVQKCMCGKLFFLKLDNHDESLLKVYCYWMKLTFNHIVNSYRKSFVSPFYSLPWLVNKGVRILSLLPQ